MSYYRAEIAYAWRLLGDRRQMLSIERRLLSFSGFYLLFRFLKLKDLHREATGWPTTPLQDVKGQVHTEHEYWSQNDSWLHSLNIIEAGTLMNGLGHGNIPVNGFSINGVEQVVDLNNCLVFWGLQEPLGIFEIILQEHMPCLQSLGGQSPGSFLGRLHNTWQGIGTRSLFLQ